MMKTPRVPTGWESLASGQQEAAQCPGKGKCGGAQENGTPVGRLWNALDFGTICLNQHSVDVWGDEKGCPLECLRQESWRKERKTSIKEASPWVREWPILGKPEDNFAPTSKDSDRAVEQKDSSFFYWINYLLKIQREAKNEKALPRADPPPQMPHRRVEHNLGLQCGWQEASRLSRDHCLPGTALAGMWSQELEPGIKTGHTAGSYRRLNPHLSTRSSIGPLCLLYIGSSP